MYLNLVLTLVFLVLLYLAHIAFRINENLVWYSRRSLKDNTDLVLLARGAKNGIWMIADGPDEARKKIAGL